jgi:hypothetical protein
MYWKMEILAGVGNKLQAQVVVGTQLEIIYKLRLPKILGSQELYKCVKSLIFLGDGPGLGQITGHLDQGSRK